MTDETRNPEILAEAEGRAPEPMEEDNQKACRQVRLLEYPAVSFALDRITNGTDPLYRVVYFYGDGNKLSKRMDMLACAYIEQHPGAKVVIVTADDFIHGMINSIKYGIPDSHPVSFRDCDFLIMKDFEKYGGKEACMEELYYILDHRLLSRKPFVICADRLPNAIPGLADRLLTILEGGLIYQY